MSNKRLCLSGARDQQHEEKDGEGGKDGTHASTVALSSSERCPICLNSLSLEVGFPEDCCHAFCISCILKWSETSTSCPVDRKPFQTVYKIDPVFGCTKIHVVARRQRENCSCNLCQSCCTKGKIYFRMGVIKKSANEIMNNSTKDGCKYDEIPELESRNQSYDGLCLTDDFMVASISDPTEINYINSSEVEEESALCLIQRKREGLNHLRLPTTLERIESNSSLSVETLIHSPSFWDDYISAIRPLSVRNKGFSKRTCVHTCAQEGTEKKQAASGSKGTRKKSVQSSTRRRSTRNSKSDVSQLQSSPKSSNSDNDAPGCNSSSTNTLSTEQPSKPLAKRRKRTPKKAQTRKRLRSATQTPQEADESKVDSDSESEKDEKKLKIPDLSASTQFEEIMPPASPTEKANQPEDHSSVLSPMDQSTEEDIPASSPMQNVESFVKETSASPELQNEYLIEKENSPPSPIFTNGQTTAEKSQPESMFESELGSDVVETAKHLSTEVGHSLQAEILQVSEGESQGSPLSVKCTDVYCNKESASSDSENELEVHEKHTISSALSEDVPHRVEQDYSDIVQTGVQSSESLNESQSSGFSQSKAEHLSDLEDKTEFSEAGEYTSLPAVDTEKQSHLEHSPSSCDSFKENPPEIPDLPKVLTVELPVQDSSFKSDEELGDKQVNGVENGSQEPKLTDSEISVPGESTHMSTTDSSVNRTPLSEQSTVEELCDVGEVQDGLCNDDLQNVRLVDKTECISEVSSAVSISKMSDDTNIGKESDFNKEQVTYSEDNNESVAMECDSVCSDREPEQPTKLTETVVAEPGSLVSTKTEELESTEKQSVPLEEKQKKESRPRKSRFHSPSTRWSPTKSEVKERQKSRSRSRSKNRDSPMKRKSRSRSKDRDHSEQWKGRSRDRRNRRQSRSKSRSRSRSGSRTRDRNRSNTAERSEKDSPWRERRSNDNWKSPRGTDRYRRNEHEKTNEHFRSDKYDPRDSSEPYPDNKNDHPDWVSEKIKSFDSRGRGDGWIRGDRGDRGRGWGDNRGRGRGENRGRGDHRGRGDFRGRGDHRGRGDGRGRGGNRGRGSPRSSHWEDNQCDSWNRNVNMDWNSPRGRGGRGRGSFRGGFNYVDQNENSWNNRQPFSGNCNTIGQEPTWVQEHKNYKAKFEETFELPVDRSGWTSASSWAVRKTLPADVQNYYSKRGRNAPGSQQGWTRPEVSQDQDQTLKDQPSQQTESAPMPVNMVQTPMNVVQQPMNAPPPQPVNIYPYSVAVPPPLVSMQHNPYNIHPQLPIHLHPALPIVQVSAPSSVPQGLPPPPPPPPPSQQVGYVAPQQDGKPMQANPSVSHVSNNLAAQPLPTPAVAQGGVVGTAVAPSSASVAASGHSKNPYVSVKPALWKETVTVEASADSSKKEKKIVIQERAAHEVKVAIKQYYQNKDITKDEYKEIVKKAVDKVCHSKSGEVDSAKVANLVKAYVDKYKHSRKKGSEDRF